MQDNKEGCNYVHASSENLGHITDLYMHSIATYFKVAGNLDLFLLLLLQISFRSVSFSYVLSRCHGSLNKHGSFVNLVYIIHIYYIAL